MNKNSDHTHWPQAHTPKSKTMPGMEWKYECKKILK